MSNCFTAYGLTIQSAIDLQIPHADASSQPDVTVCFGTITDSCAQHSWDGVRYRFQGRAQLILTFERVGTYLIRDGREVIIDPEQPINHDNIRQPILGTVMAMVLHQRGCLVLHGSALVIEGSAKLFIGWKGQGKSTLAAYLNKAGYPLATDDVCALDMKGGHQISIRPAFPRLRLSPEVLSFLGDDPDHHPRSHPEYEKRLKTIAPDQFFSADILVGAVYILEEGEEQQVERLNGMEAVKELIMHMLINRFPEKRPANIQEEMFFQTTLLVKEIPVFRLTRPKVLGNLTETMRYLKKTAWNC